jgi:uncharacterized damage-inducible protein DinB
MRSVLSVILVVLAPAVAAAQTAPRPANPVTAAVQQLLARDSKNLVGAAELMPADKYSYHPTPAQMTFGHLVMHVAQSNVALCAAISGTPAADLGKLADTDPKDALVAAIRKSFDYCTTALDKVTDAQLGDEITIFGGRKATRAFALVTVATDWADHYSAAASYLRLNGILPPSAQQMGRGRGRMN